MSEDAVGSTATYRREYTEPTVDQVQVVPVWENGVVVGEPRQALVGEGRIRGRELRIAVGRQIDPGEALVCRRCKGRQGHGDDRIIPVIAYVRRAWHDAAPYLAEHVWADARRGR